MTTATATAAASPAVPAITPLIKPAAAIASAEFIPTLPVANIVPSPNNPRRRFDQAKLEELAQSIGQRGLVHPILVRPLAGQAGKFEIVAGERRYRAAKIAALTSIPATVQQLDDLAVAEIQLMENERRQDLNALEEAIGYQNWIKQKHPGTDKQHTIDDIATKVKKSRRHIHNRLALLKLAPEVQDAISAGTLESSKALLLTLVGNTKLQVEVMKEYFDSAEDGELPSARDLAKHIADKYQTELTKSVPFDITVLDYRTPKGDIINKGCETCPRRSGNDRDLFADIKSANVCTDIACFRAKTAAETQRRIDKLDTKTVTVIRGKEAEKMFGRLGHFSSSDYMEKDAAFHDVPYESKAYGQPIKKLLGKDLPITYVENPTTFKLEEVVDREKAKKLLAKAGLTKKPTSNTSDNNPRSADARAKQKLEQEQMDAGHKALFMAVRQARTSGKALPRVAMERIAALLHYECDNPILGHAWSDTPLENDVAAEKHAWAVMKDISKVSDAKLLDIVFDLALACDQSHPKSDAYKESLPVTAAKAYGLDPAKIVKDAAAEVKAAAAAKAKPKVITPPAAPVTKKPAAKKPAAKTNPTGRPKNKGVDAKMQAQIDKEVLAQERKRAKKGGAK